MWQDISKRAGASQEGGGPPGYEVQKKDTKNGPPLEASLEHLYPSWWVWLSKSHRDRMPKRSPKDVQTSSKLRFGKNCKKCGLDTLFTMFRPPRAVQKTRVLARWEVYDSCQKKQNLKSALQYTLFEPQMATSRCQVCFLCPKWGPHRGGKIHPNP